MFSFLCSIQENYFYAKFNLKNKDIASKLRKTNGRLLEKNELNLKEMEFLKTVSK